MDLVADELVRELAAHFSTDVEVESVRPQLARRASSLPRVGTRRTARQADIFLGRYWDYPRFLEAKRAELFHVSDHSYSHLLHRLPSERAGVYCHDLDAFRCLLEPRAEPRPFWFRTLIRHVLEGMQRAAVVFYSTGHVRAGIERAGLVASERLVHAPYGTAHEFVAEPAPHDSQAQRALGLSAGSYVMHVGSCIPRKRVDVLLAAYAEARRRLPELRLLQVGGSWTAEQADLLGRLGIEHAAVQIRGIPRAALAALYRGAVVLLQPSEAEGFGLPIIEALACGTPVVASDIAALREAGGNAAAYAPVGDVEAFLAGLVAAVEGSSVVPERSVRLAHAARFTWTNHAQVILDSYRRLLGMGSAKAP